MDRIKIFSDGEVLTADDLNIEFSNVVDGVNAISNDNIVSNAAITPNKLASSIAGDGLSRNGSTGILSVNTDNTSLEVVADQVQVKDGGISFAKLAAAAINSLIPTGSIIPFAGTTAPTGWLLASGETIGNVASNSTLRANADTETLYTLLYNSISLLLVYDSAGTLTSRGASAAADYAANKRLAVPDMRGRIPVGRDNMGALAAATRSTSLTLAPDGQTLGASGGFERHQLTAAQKPVHTHVVTDPGHTHLVNLPVGINDETVAGSLAAGQQPLDAATSNLKTTSYSGMSSAVTGITNQNAGGTDAHLNMQPSIILNYILKL